MTFMAGLTNAQQNLLRASPIILPVLHNDKTVTFRLLAPNAKEITNFGDWMSVKDFVRLPEAMVKTTDCLWLHTTPALPSELYTYTFTVDGVRCTEPNNAFAVGDVANLTNVFIVGGGSTSLLKFRQKFKATNE